MRERIFNKSSIRGVIQKVASPMDDLMECMVMPLEFSSSDSYGIRITSHDQMLGDGKMYCTSWDRTNSPPLLTHVSKIL